MHAPTRTVLDSRGFFSRAEHQSHRRLAFAVPAAVEELRITLGYEPKLADSVDPVGVIRTAIQDQASILRGHQPADERLRLVDAWVRSYTERLLEVGDGSGIEKPALSNLLTLSVDDAAGVYRGAGHRQLSAQTWRLGPASASDGLVAGPLPAGIWSATLTGHTIVSDIVGYTIQIGALIAARPPVDL